MSRLIVITVGSGRGAVSLDLSAQGRDLLLRITGGAAHIGAIALASPTGDGAGDPEVRQLVLGRHREGPIAVEAARRISRAGARVVAVLAGVHIDDASPEEIAALLENIRSGLSQLEVWIGKNIASIGR